MIRSLFFIFTVIAINTIHASEIKPTISLKISDVKTTLINNKYLIRVIEFNAEREPKIVIERLSRPSVKVLEKLVISKVKVGNRVIDFKDSAAISFESIYVDGNSIKFLVYFVFSGKGGGAIDFECAVKVNNDKFSQPICTEK